jgi:hypothetical protein
MAELKEDETKNPREAKDLLGHAAKTQPTAAHGGMYTQGSQRDR